MSQLVRFASLGLLVGLVGCSLPSNVRYRCEADGGCSSGTRCEFDRASVGYCVPVGDGGGSPAGRAVDLVFDNTDGGSLDLFPVLVTLDASKIDYAAVARPSTDLRFHDPDTNQDLAFQIDTWNPAGESTVWVLVPNIAAGSAVDRITLYSGAEAGGTEDATGRSVWGGSYEGVWHLGPGALTNSASAQYGGTSAGASGVAGQIGSGLRFSGTASERVTFAGGEALFDGWGAFAMELWIRADYATLAGIVSEGGVLDKGGGLNLGRVFATGSGASRVLLFQVDMHFTGSGNDTYLNTGLPLQAWTYVAYTFDGKAVTMYANGQQVNRATFANTVTMVPGNNAFFLGGYNTPILGAVDELRISRVTRSADWIRAQHRSMTGQFVTFRPR